jgi:SAM-dependent methyltransferase
VEPTPHDYDSDPERFRTGTRVTRAHLPAGFSVYGMVAARLTDFAATRILDIGAGEGALREALTQGRLVSLDASATMLRAVPPPVVQAEAGRLPFAEHAFDAAVAINVFDHVPDPITALREARRVLGPGGALIAGTISRRDSPELAAVWRPRPTPFDSEAAPDLMNEVFDTVAVESWDTRLLVLPDRAALRDYLIARFVPPTQAAERAERVSTPIRLTKHGALVIGRTT